MKNVWIVLTAVILSVSGLASAAQIPYQINSANSIIGFKVKHSGIDVAGKFNKVDGKVMVENGHIVSIEGTIQVDSIDTGDAKRDAYLKSDEFFAQSQFPEIKFKSTWFTVGWICGYGASCFDQPVMVGDLTIRDVTKSIELKGSPFNVRDSNPEINRDRDNNGTTLNLSVEGKINRQDFGLKFNKLTELIRGMVDNDVVLTIELEANGPVVVR